MSITLKPLSEQVIVITGASSGIGLATVEAAARERARLVLVARSEQTLSELVTRLQAEGIEAIQVTADVGDREQVERAAEVAIGRFGRIDTWVNDAGVSIYGRVDEVSLDDARRMFDTNFWGVVQGSLVALRHMRRGGGAIINIGSEVSEAAIPLQGYYVASKHAVKGFTDSMRIEVEEIDKAPVSITLIEPGATDTPFPENARNYMDREPKLPSPMSDPADVAEAILRAATKPTRLIKVGASARMNTTVAKVAPGLADKMAARQEKAQQRDEPPRNPKSTLDQPGESGRVRGRS
jgi:short-subunit dehydrogenase